ncbi:phospholipase effector Tle1 domain-containing protein [Flavobacterium hercynium]|uniref:T6SS Phospholipase effector Tle1-like catalytic domain-containing protein n=1 Tax=Flavobacterium hercynium TaxID=387094 RepID=A0A226GUZ8_9FLAO|nr:DUF2235 domain-containing protein [Flavobacterium hercynium]OXA85889.1 hypothetical protein B0A66_18700 [Flavobacterium hercynium]SMP33723.1 Uncharacterized alpha/beta hydrolase domain [Flavobacterium hercynium]
MGKSIVYNTGLSEDDLLSDELQLSFGVFIDGTLNNKKNTELRRKYRNGGVENLTDKEIKQSVKDDEEAYDALENTEITDETPEYDRYLIASHRSRIDKLGTDNSFSNDYTNVARMWKCCEEVIYRIYIEGMGTEDNSKDSQDGFAFGSGLTGIRAKVRKGCKDLAAKIVAEKKKDSKKVVTQIVVDVFGFSRGAASARNFAHEVNVKKAYAPRSIQIPDGFYPVDPYSTRDEMPQPKYRPALADADGLEIEEDGLIKGMLPRMGYLGYCLQLGGVLSEEEIENLKIVVRFLGVYDTVSSYFENGDQLGQYDYKGDVVDDSQLPKLAKQKMSNQFLNNVKPLHLNDFGYVEKVVHFTAKDEHRENFDLTRIAGANLITRIIEKNFPGVHCDIGGAYENEMERIEKLETSRFFHKSLYELRERLIKEYWFTEEQIFIVGTFWNFVTRGLTRRIINTERFVRKEYSYIPLHFMEEFCRETNMNEYLIRKTEEDYPIDDNELLVGARSYLRNYVFGDSKEWEFKDDEQLAMEKMEKEYKKMQLDQPLYDLNEQGDYYSPKPLSDYLPKVDESANNVDVDISDELEPKTVTLEEVVVRGIDPQKTLRELRRGYLHWSSHRRWFGMEPAPTDDRVRVEH